MRSFNNVLSNLSIAVYMCVYIYVYQCVCLCTCVHFTFHIDVTNTFTLFRIYYKVVCLLFMSRCIFKQQLLFFFVFLNSIDILMFCHSFGMPNIVFNFVVLPTFFTYIHSSMFIVYERLFYCETIDNTLHRCVFKNQTDNYIRKTKWRIQFNNVLLLFYAQTTDMCIRVVFHICHSSMKCIQFHIDFI